MLQFPRRPTPLTTRSAATARGTLPTFTGSFFGLAVHPIFANRRWSRWVMSPFSSRGRRSLARSVPAPFPASQATGAVFLGTTLDFPRGLLRSGFTWDAALSAATSRALCFRAVHWRDSEIEMSTRHRYYRDSAPHGAQGPRLSTWVAAGCSEKEGDFLLLLAVDRALMVPTQSVRPPQKRTADRGCIR